MHELKELQVSWTLADANREIIVTTGYRQMNFILVYFFKTFFVHKIGCYGECNDDCFQILRCYSLPFYLHLFVSRELCNRHFGPGLLHFFYKNQ